jgi:hypothetical protein
VCKRALQFQELAQNGAHLELEKKLIQLRIRHTPLSVHCEQRVDQKVDWHSTGLQTSLHRTLLPPLSDLNLQLKLNGAMDRFLSQIVKMFPQNIFFLNIPYEVRKKYSQDASAGIK